MLSDEDKKKMTNRLRRVVGQVEAVGRMIEADNECVDILMQLSAATGALGKIGEIVLEDHLKASITKTLNNRDPADRQAEIEELIALLRKYADV
ncbi:Copper-sensing transcriptional repressor CsoR [Novipirellula artificiosorum]|uniref:Copper-sensing transcriptional repressor CsoR n=2 Tax=Novipirellula artificiosorum TaxID=2528016 RepID=A0A5C6DT37_9BACT|nr:Copper-sensing transcriptional repressor CsoR [Novipirellula artificiosorum]